MVVDWTKLTNVERHVATLLAVGYGRLEIGRLFAISPKTVDTHRARIMAKLGLENSAELARVAIRDGVISVHDEAEHDKTD